MSRVSPLLQGESSDLPVGRIIVSLVTRLSAPSPPGANDVYPRRRTTHLIIYEDDSHVLQLVFFVAVQASTTDFLSCGHRVRNAKERAGSLLLLFLDNP